MATLVNWCEYYNSTIGNSTGSGEPTPSVSLLTLPYYFTTRTEMERLFSVGAVELRRDDFEGNDVEKANVLQEIVVQATYEVKAILNSIFDDSDLAAHPWVRRRATIIGCYMLSIRRGNDAQYYNEYLDALADLQDLLEGKLYIGLPTSVGASASMVNVSTDNRFPFSPVRADPATSTDYLQGIKFPRYYTPYYWL